MAKKITSKQFNQIRDLKKAELSNILIAKIVGLSDTTVRRMSQFDNFVEYKKWIHSQTIKWRENKEVDNESEVNQEIPKVTVPTSTNDERVIRTIQNLTDAINRIADILETDSPLVKEAKEFKLFGRR